MKGFDVAANTVGHASEFKKAGYGAVGLYLRLDRTSKAMVDELHGQGLKLWSIYEAGYPTSAAYFTQAQAKKDATRALLVAKAIGQPEGSQIFPCVDYDPTVNEVAGPITSYQRVFQQYVKASGYLASVYGSGLVCAALTKQGLAHSGWLSQSTGFAWYKDYKPHAAIIQGPVYSLKVATAPHSFDVDLDTVVDASVLW